MPGIRRIGIGIGISGQGGGGGLSSALKSKFLFLWEGDFDGDDLDNSVGTDVMTVNSKDFSTDYIPATSSATFNMPNTTAYQDADTDNLWYDAGINDVTVAEMVAADFDRTFIKYDNTSPYHVRKIGILKSGETLTQANQDELSTYFELDVFYFGVFNDNGFVKENRSSGSGYTTEYQAVYDAMTNKPSETVADNQNVLVSELKTAGVWSKGDIILLLAQESDAGNETLINWISPGVNDATKNGTPSFVSLEGLTGSASPLASLDLYNPTVSATNYTQNDACLAVYLRTENTIAGEGEVGLELAGPDAYLKIRTTRIDAQINDEAVIYQSGGGLTTGKGLTLINRTGATARSIWQNKTLIKSDTQASSGLPDGIFKGLAVTLAESTKQSSFIYVGGSLTQTQIEDMTDAIEKYMDSNSKGVIA